MYREKIILNYIKGFKYLSTSFVDKDLEQFLLRRYINKIPFSIFLKIIKIVREYERRIGKPDCIELRAGEIEGEKIRIWHDRGEAKFFVLKDYKNGVIVYDYFSITDEDGFEIIEKYLERLTKIYITLVYSKSGSIFIGENFMDERELFCYFREGYFDVIKFEKETEEYKKLVKGIIGKEDERLDWVYFALLEKKEQKKLINKLKKYLERDVKVLPVLKIWNSSDGFFIKDPSNVSLCKYIKYVENKYYKIKSRREIFFNNKEVIKEFYKETYIKSRIITFKKKNLIKVILYFDFGKIKNFFQKKNCSEVLEKKVLLNNVKPS